MASLRAQLALDLPELSPRADYRAYPRLRFMGSKHRLLPWLETTLRGLDFDSALDPFSGSGCVSYLLKTMGKEVHSSDFLRFATDFTRALVANSTETLAPDDVELLLGEASGRLRFVETQFRGIFFSDEDNRFLDQVSENLSALSEPKRALARSALYRACLKRQPRGVFTVSGVGRYDDGRRDLRLPLRDHFVEGVDLLNALVFDNGRANTASCGDVFDLEPPSADLVYLDPPYVPRADDNCYIKRYHFLEGLASYWRDVEFHPTSKVKKLKKRYTPFSYRKDAESAFARLFQIFGDSTIVLSYSSNGYPDLERLVEILRRTKRDIEVYSEEHRYHFGTHARVSPTRSVVTEYLIVGQ